MFKKIVTILILSMVLTTTTIACSTEESQEYKVERKTIIVEEKPNVTKEDIELIALVTMAEAEGECEYGKRLVIDTILNRVDSEHFPDTIQEVVYEENAFSSMWNGRVDRCYVDTDICKLVKEELKIRTNRDVIYFTAREYGEYGNPMFIVDNHYFSSY